MKISEILIDELYSNPLILKRRPRIEKILKEFDDIEAINNCYPELHPRFCHECRVPLYSIRLKLENELIRITIATKEFSIHKTNNKGIITSRYVTRAENGIKALFRMVGLE
jgi:hypothetical protein